MSKRRATAYFYLLLTSVIWGVAGPIIKFTLTDFPPLIFLSYRFGISTVIGIAILAANRHLFKVPKKTDLLILVLVWAFLNSTARLGLLFFGFDETTSIAGTLITAITPVFMSLAGLFFLRERVTKTERIGMSIAFAGTMLSVAEPLFAAEAMQLTTSLRGNVIVFISLLIDVTAVLLLKFILRRNVTPALLAHLTFIVGFISMIPLTLYTYNWQTVVATILEAPLAAHAGVWFMALISGTLGYYLHSKGLKSIEMGEASIFTYLTPLWAAPLSLFWLGEKISGVFMIGAAIITVGVAIAEYKRRIKTVKSGGP